MPYMPTITIKATHDYPILYNNANHETHHTTLQSIKNNNIFNMLAILAAYHYAKLPTEIN